MCQIGVKVGQVKVGKGLFADADRIAVERNFNGLLPDMNVEWDRPFIIILLPPFQHYKTNNGINDYNSVESWWRNFPSS